jgi:hypothetical protein
MQWDFLLPSSAEHILRTSKLENNHVLQYAPFTVLQCVHTEFRTVLKG